MISLATLWWRVRPWVRERRKQQLRLLTCQHVSQESLWTLSPYGHPLSVSNVRILFVFSLIVLVLSPFLVLLLHIFVSTFFSLFFNFSLSLTLPRIRDFWDHISIHIRTVYQWGVHQCRRYQILRACCMHPLVARSYITYLWIVFHLIISYTTS